MEVGTILLENSHLSLAFSVEAKGGVVSVAQKMRELELRRSRTAPALLYRVSIVENRQEIVLSNLDARGLEHRREAIPGGKRLVLIGRGLGKYAIDVEVTVSLLDDSPQSEWTIKVRNHETLPICRVDFPYIDGYAGLGDDPAADTLLIPQTDGLLIRDPLGYIRKGKSIQAGLDTTAGPAVYPGTQTVQFMAVYHPAGGFMISSHDTEGHIKHFALARSDPEERYRAFCLAHLCPEVPRADFCSGFPIRITAFRGDWYDAADIYKRWARDQWWCLRKGAEKDIPGWFANDLAPILSVPYDTEAGQGAARRVRPNLAALSAEYAQFLGTRVITRWTGWEKWGAWTSPDFFPPFGGEKLFHATATDVVQNAGPIEFFFSEAYWISRTGEEKRMFEGVGRRDAMQGRDGKIMSFDDELGWVVPMCPSTAGWQAMLAKNVREFVRRGVMLVQLDMFPVGATRPCYAREHAHPPGYGSWFFQSSREIACRALLAGRSENLNFVLSAENMCEVYVPYFDCWLSRDDERRELTESWKPHQYKIPLVNYIYHEYIPTQAARGLMTSPFFGRTLSHQVAIGKRLAFMADFYPGRVETGNPPPSEEAGLVRQNLAFLKAACDSQRALGAQTVFSSEMLRPPDIEFLPETSTGWVRLSRESDEPAVGTLRSPTGEVAVIVANGGPGSGKLKVQLPLRLTDEKACLVRIYRNGERVHEDKRELPTEMQAEIGPRTVIIFKVTPGSVAARGPGWEEELLAEARKDQEKVNAGLRELTLRLPESVEVLKNIVYGKGGGQELHLDLYLPKNGGAALRPGLVFLHGGSWIIGHRDMLARHAIHMAEHGFASATVQYRFSTEARFPAALEDAKGAVRWMRANAGKYRIDPERIGAVGGSAGGHLASMLGATGGIAEFEGQGGHAEYSSRVQAVVAFNPETDLVALLKESDALLLPCRKFLGATLGERPDLYRWASPTTYVDPSDPPFILFHGTDDLVAPMTQSVAMHNLLQDAGVESELHLTPGATHGFFNRSPYYEDTLSRMLIFLAKHLGAG